MADAPDTPLYANSFNVLPTRNTVTMLFAFAAAGQPAEYAAKVGYVAMETPFARKMAQMIIDTTSPEALDVRDAEIAAAAKLAPAPA